MLFKDLKTFLLLFCFIQNQINKEETKEKASGVHRYAAQVAVNGLLFSVQNIVVLYMKILKTKK